eukprot:849534-Rhodomonas_salina.2
MFSSKRRVRAHLFAPRAHLLAMSSHHPLPPPPHPRLSKAAGALPASPGSTIRRGQYQDTRRAPVRGHHQSHQGT